MEKKQAQILIEDTFNDSFNEDRFTVFVKNLLNDLEPKSNVYSGNLIWDDYKEHINSYKRIGKYIDPEGEALDVLIVEVKSVTKLERARTALRNFVIKHMSKFEKDYALVAFYSKEDDGADWRFSFIKLEYRSELDEQNGKVKTKKEFTPAKRYSFLVGKYEKAHTAKNQLLPLLQNISNNPTIEELESAFSIEKVTDEFFNQYKDLYIKLYEHFENDKKVKAAIKEAGIDNARFTKKLLGQIVFLYFLQKKGWLGVDQNARWGTGKKRFVQELFIQAQNEDVNFFKDKLQYLFYEALAKERDNENSFYERFNCRIPFLNGGLFEADYKWEDANISIPETLFRNEEKNKSGDIGTGILDVFGRYNFTIKEDEPLDKEVAVDPEMLGKVFENMLDITERKSKGAFYTPREIVHYMCQESLIHYLDNALNIGTSSYQEFGSDQAKLFGGSTNKNGNLKIELENTDNIRVPKKDIETFIHEGHFALENDERVANKGETKTYQFQLPESIRKNADLIDKSLSSIKICDPAIGSGAFPVGLLHELVNAMLVLKPHLSYDYLTEKLKGFEFTHRESISDSRYIYRLKRHIIQESIYGVDIDSSAIDIARLRLWLSLVVDEDDLDPIETLPNLDYKIVAGNSLIGFPEGWNSPAFEKIENLKREFYNETDEIRKKELKASIESEIQDRLKTSKRVFGYQVDFDFKLFFSEVWREKGGFDVVIGNPPYLQIQYLSDEVKDVFKRLTYRTFNLRGDIYEMFYEKGQALLKREGHLCFITSNKWMRANYGKSTRNFFLKEVNPILLFDFGQEMIFSSAIVHSNILLFQNKKYNNNLLGATVSKEKPFNKTLINHFEDNKISLNFKYDEVWSISNNQLTLLRLKFEKKGVILEKWDNKITRGIITGFNEAFILDQNQFKQLAKNKANLKLLKKIVRGRDIRKFYCKDSNKWIIEVGYNEHENIKKNYPEIYLHLSNFEGQLKERGQVVNGQHHWLELDNTPSKQFFEQFKKPKIVFSEIVSDPQFCYEPTGLYPEATSFFIVGTNLKWLCALLNSQLITIFFRIFYAGGELVGKYRYKKTFLNSLPVILPNPKCELLVNILVDYLSFAKESLTDDFVPTVLTTFYEALIDTIVYELYFPEEIKSAGKEILKHLGDLKPITEDMSEEKKLAIIQSEFERLYDPNHPVRFAIETLDSVEEVRIIKEALK
jgi:hypothetical protein